MAIADLIPPELPKPEDCRSLRETAGLSRTQFAAYIGVSESALISWETGTRNAKGLQRKAYAKALKELYPSTEDAKREKSDD